MIKDTLGEINIGFAMGLAPKKIDEGECGSYKLLSAQRVSQVTF